MSKITAAEIATIESFARMAGRVGLDLLAETHMIDASDYQDAAENGTNDKIRILDDSDRALALAKAAHSRDLADECARRSAALRD